MLKVPMRAWLILPTMLALQACVGGASIVATPAACLAFIPESWRLPVEGAPLPSGQTVGDWIAFGDAQTGRLDIANGRLADSYHIVGECERLNNEAVKRSRPRFLGIF